MPLVDTTSTQQNIEALLKDVYDWVREHGLEDSLTEIMCNEDGCVWIDAGRFYDTGIRYSPARVLVLIEAVAGLNGKVVNADNPEVGATLGGRRRFQGLIPPAVSSPVFSLRIPSKKFLLVEDLVSSGMLTLGDSEFLIECVRERKNIMICGGTGSGKTTLANALLQVITDDRVLVIEDNPEIRLNNARNKVHLLTGSRFSSLDALLVSMRMRPDRIVVGEVRDGNTALQLLKAWTTGHPGGIGTVHANSIEDMTARFLGMFHEVNFNDLFLMYRAVDIAVSVEKVMGSDDMITRRVTGIGYPEKGKNFFVPFEKKALGQVYDI